MHSRLTTLYLLENGQNFPLTKVKYNSIVLKEEKQLFAKRIQVQRRMGLRNFACVLCSVMQYYITTQRGMFGILGHM